MPGERTLIRVYIDSEENINYQLMTEGLFSSTLYQVAGLLERIQDDVIEDAKGACEGEEMTEKEVDDVRGLLDKKDDKSES